MRYTCNRYPSDNSDQHAGKTDGLYKKTATPLTSCDVVTYFSGNFRAPSECCVLGRL